MKTNKNENWISGDLDIYHLLQLYDCTSTCIADKNYYDRKNSIATLAFIRFTTCDITHDDMKLEWNVALPSLKPNELFSHMKHYGEFIF